jgi:SAM-dependent methyltransferase
VIREKSLSFPRAEHEEHSKAVLAGEAFPSNGGGSKTENGKMPLSSKRTYTSAWHGWHSFWTSIRNDVKAHWQDPKERVSILLDEAQEMELLLFDHRLQDADVLEVGPGHVPIQLMYFARNNRAVGIDVNRVTYHRTPWALLQIARESGSIRAAKTLGRWVLGYDSRLQDSVAQRLGEKTVSWPRMLQMDVRQMDFQDGSFDFVYSRSVFQHVKDPARAIQEIGRVLKRGGAALISLHLWTCPNGYTYVPAPWEWPHLRGQALPHEIDQSRNRLRLAEWRQLFEAAFPGCEIRLRGPETPEMINRALELRKTELTDYSLEELISYDLSVSWRKR